MLVAAACGSGAEDRPPLHEAAAPPSVPVLAPRGSISVGAGQACAIAAGRVACWSSGGSQAVATRVAGVDNAMQVVVDLGLACALGRGGRVACWTTDNAGGCRAAPGSGRLRRTIDPPEGVACGLHEVPSLEGAVELAIAGWHACARTAAGISCWLGTRGAPAVLAGSAGAISFFALVGGRVLGWTVAGETARPLGGIKATGADAVRIAAGTNQICALGRGVTCWTDRGTRREHTLAAVDLGVGAAACARTTADRVACWGAREEPMLLPRLTAAPH